jgi:hypothetical protein
MQLARGWHNPTDVRDVGRSSADFPTVVERFDADGQAFGFEPERLLQGARVTLFLFRVRSRVRIN